MAEKLSIGSLSPDFVFETLVNKGLDRSDAAVFVGEWILGEFGSGLRSFNYVQGFDAAKPDCVPKFVRRFAHRDWVDGEDTVQAAESAGEEGFNKRFHAIERDLDAVGEDAAHVFGCVAEMRRDLRALLDEIRNELNRLNGLLGRQPTGTQTGPLQTGVLNTGTLLGSIKFNDLPMTLWQTGAGLMMLPATQVINPNPLEDPRATRPGNFAKFVDTNPDVRRTFGGTVSKQDFLKKFGSEKLEDGTLVRELIQSLPDNAQFASLDAMVDDLVAREAVSLRTTGGADAAIASAFGIDMSTQKPAEASIEKFRAIPPAAREALIRNGIDTLGKLSEAGAGKVSAILERESVRDVTLGDAADWSARATTISRLR